MIERWLEKILFSSRWLLAPIYLGLVVGLVALVVKDIQHIVHMVPNILNASESDLVLDILGLIDLSLTASLVIIVIFSGYENFVSRIVTAGHEDWPEWMSKIDFTGLKLKLLSSIVAISAIQLLRAFMDINKTSDRDLMWYVIIHVVFVSSGLLLALTDRLSEHPTKDDGKTNGH
jgi:uncharacterized protein (TIGR00645 family)